MKCNEGIISTIPIRAIMELWIILGGWSFHLMIRSQDIRKCGSMAEWDCRRWERFLSCSAKSVGDGFALTTKNYSLVTRFYELEFLLKLERKTFRLFTTWWKPNVSFPLNGLLMIRSRVRILMHFITWEATLSILELSSRFASSRRTTQFVMTLIFLIKYDQHWN